MNKVLPWILSYKKCMHIIFKRFPWKKKWKLGMSRGCWGFFCHAQTKTQINNFLKKSLKNQRLLFAYLISAERFWELFSLCLSTLLTSSSLLKASFFFSMLHRPLLLFTNITIFSGNLQFLEIPACIVFWKSRFINLGNLVVKGLILQFWTGKHPSLWMSDAKIPGVSPVAVGLEFLGGLIPQEKMVWWWTLV